MKRQTVLFDFVTGLQKNRVRVDVSNDGVIEKVCFMESVCFLTPIQLANLQDRVNEAAESVTGPANVDAAPVDQSTNLPAEKPTLRSLMKGGGGAHGFKDRLEAAIQGEIAAGKVSGPEQEKLKSAFKLMEFFLGPRKK